MKKLLLVTDTWELVNGVTRELTSLVPLLEKEGLQVVVVHPGLFPRHFRFPFYPEIQGVFLPGKRMNTFFDLEQPDYVHIATEGNLGIAARAICLKRKKPFTTFYHTNFPLYVQYYLPFGKFLSPIASAYMRWFHGKAAAMMMNTASIKELLAREGGYPTMVVSAPGIDTERFVRSVPPATFPILTAPVFVYMGRVAKEKNIDEFLSAELPGTKLVIGDGPYRETLEKKYTKNTLFVGYKKGQDLVDWLSMGDVCVFPSVSETFGLAMAEAMACGLPIAAHDAPGPRDVITNGVDGVMSPNLTEAAIACLSLSKEAARSKALQYSWEASAKRFRETVEQYS